MGCPILARPTIACRDAGQGGTALSSPGNVSRVLLSPSIRRTSMLPHPPRHPSRARACALPARAAARPAGAGPAGLRLAGRAAEDAQRRAARGRGQPAGRAAARRPGARQRLGVPAAGLQLVLDGRAPDADPRGAPEPGHPVLPAGRRPHRPRVPARGARRGRARRARAHPRRRPLHRRQRPPAARHRRLPERAGAAVQPVPGRPRVQRSRAGGCRWPTSQVRCSTRFPPAAR